MHTAADGPTSLEGFDRARHVSALLDRGRTDHARPIIATALREAPGDLDMLFQAARADVLDDRLDDARSLVEDVLKAEPEHVDARFLLVGILTRQGDLAAAEAQCLSLLERFPRDGQLYLAYARVMLAALLVDKASGLVNEALRLAPDDADALCMRVICDVVLGGPRPDREALRRLLVEHPEDRGTLTVLVTTLVEAGRFKEALRCARALMIADPRSTHWMHQIRELLIATHWSMVPLRPLQRYGWSASVALWVAGVVVVRLASMYVPVAAGWLAAAILGYCVYSWVWPPLLRKWMSRGMELDG